MKGFRLDKNTFIIDMEFTCPYCEKSLIDINDKYYKRINKNKSGITKVKCDCGKTFLLTINMWGKLSNF
jgi:transcription elongation factor Elf1